MPHTSLKNYLLVAMPSLTDPHFHKSVTYLCEHHKDGAMGITINQPIAYTLQEMLAHLALDIDASLPESTLFNGGPVQPERGFILHTGNRQWETTINIAENVSLTGSKDILVDIANNNGPEEAIIALGFAGWDSGQLEAEIAANHWLTVPADPDIIFRTNYRQQWTASAGKLGIDLNLISHQIGHA
ncbi:MAG: putative transcriptional regulator [Cellvibrionaceae bacterium]|jgi:putative transcriptional regulator